MAYGFDVRSYQTGIMESYLVALHIERTGRYIRFSHYKKIQVPPDVAEK